MNWISSLICIFLTFSSQIKHSTSSGLFELRLKSFRNDNGVNSVDKCCSEKQLIGGSCQGSCKTRFRVCLKQYQAEIDTTSSCTFGAAATPILGDNTFNFTLHSLPSKNQLKIGLSINPIRFPFEFTWPGAFTLIVEAYHDSNDNTSRSTTESLIARYSIQGELSVGSNWTQYTSSQNTKEIDFEYRVTCESNYYGSGCETLCRERDDNFGHYACSESGQRMCFSGWQGDYCTKPRCSIGCNMEHGHCEKPNECICKAGWKGPNCDECEVYPGCVHGTCTKKWECICKEGWGGLFCNQDLNFCTNHKPCHNGGTCTNTGQGSYTCKCPPGFTGVDCEIKIKDCSTNPCLNNGTCVLNENGYTCDCNTGSGWIGKHCETQTVTCAAKPCLHGGTCQDSSLGARCECTAGYSGQFCEMLVQNCSPNPCQNDGKCKALKGNHYQCQCANGFRGTTCEENIDDCKGVLCKNGGTCIDGINQYQCKCIFGYTGENCEKRVDFCLTKPCANGGSCIKLNNGFQCLCREGFTGNDCSKDIDECSSSPCKNGATCINRVNSFECICPSEFHGLNCDAAISTSSYQERQIGQSENLSSVQIALIAFLSVAVPFVAICGIAVVICMKRKRKREQEKDDAEARKQNEQNASHISHLHQHHHNSIVAIKRSSNNTIALDGSGNTHHMIKNTWDKSVNNMTNSMSMDDGCMLNTTMNIYGTMCDASPSSIAVPSNSIMEPYQSQLVVPQTLQRAKSQKQLNTDAAVVNRASIIHRQQQQQHQQHSKKDLGLDNRISTYGGETSWSCNSGNAASSSRQSMDRCSPPNI